MVPCGPAHQSLKPLSIFVPHGATKLTDHDYHGDGLIQWALIRELARRSHHLTVVAPCVSIAGEIPENVEVHVVRGLANFGLPAYMLQAFASFRRLQRTHQFDLVHQMNPVLRGATLPWAFTRVPIVLGTYVGDWPYEVPLHRMRTARIGEWLRMALKLAIDALQQRFAGALIVATPFARNRIPLVCAVRDRVWEIPHGVDIERYSPQKAANDPRLRPVSVLFIGQIAPHKGFAVILDAFDLIAASRPDARLVLVGTGNLEAAAIKRACHNEWGSRLEIVGPVPNDRVPGWIRACTLVVSAALGEPYGQSVVEALACGKPVVVNDSGGVRHLVAGTDNPVVPLGDPLALANAILALLDDESRTQALGANNRRLAVERFAWPRVVDELEKVYAAVLESNQ